MNGKDNIIFGIKSGYSYFYCEAAEVNKVTKEISDHLTNYYNEHQNGIGYKVTNWNFETNGQYNDPDSCLNLLENTSDGYDSIPVGTILVAVNFNWFMTDEYQNFNKSKTAWLLNRAAKFSSSEFRKVLIIVGSDPFEKAIPEVLKRDFAHVTFNLPDDKEIEEIYQFIVKSAKNNTKFVEPDEKTKARIISGAKGLSTSEITKVFSYSIVKNNGVFDPVTVEELRADEINSTAGLSIRKYDKKLEDLKGFENAKEIVEEWISDPDAKGIILLGPAGVGKTHFAQSIAGHYNRVIIEVEFAQLMGDGLVGQAEKSMKKALDVIRANANPTAPVVVFVDEIEKGLSGMKGGGSNDGGTTMRSNAQFLKFLSDDRPKGIYVIATCNNIESLPPEFIRAERYDCAPLFVDLPNLSEQQAILAHYQKVFSITATPKEMKGWSGAEIKTWCKLAAKKVSLGKDANDADLLIVPISKTMSKEIDYLRQWKEGKTVPASKRLVKEDKAENRAVIF
ncbi:MAG: AAA family ATPase [bacterium]